MSKQRVVSYGSWKSPITPEMAASVTQLSEVSDSWRFGLLERAPSRAARTLHSSEADR